MKLKGTKLRKTTSIINRSALFGAPLLASLTPGLFLSLVCLQLNMSNLQIGFVNAIPSLALPAQILSALVAIYVGKRKKFWFLTCGTARLLIPFLILPLVALPTSWEGAAPLIFIGIFGIYHFFQALSTPLWFSWLTDLIPEREQPGFWGQRNTLTFISGLLVSLALGVAIDLPYERVSILVVIYLIVAASGISEMVFYTKVPSTEMAISNDVSLGGIVRETIANRDFRVFLTYNGFYHFSTFVFVPFLFIHMDSLGFSGFAIQGIMAIGALGAILGSMFWSGLAANSGNKPILVICSFLKAFAVFLFVFLSDSTSWFVIAPIFFFDGFLNGGIMTANLALLGAETPQKNRSLFTAFYFSLTGLAGFAGAFSSGFLMDAVPGMLSLVAMDTIHPYHVLLSISSVLFLLSVGVLMPYRGHTQGTTLNTIAMMFEGNPFVSFIRLTQLKGQSSLRNRISFITRNRSRLFIDDMLKAIEDSSPMVREAAIVSLGYIPISTSVEALRPLVKNEESGLSVLASKSLGRLKAREAVPELLCGLESQDRALRSTSAWALGEIQDRTCLKPLKQALEKEKSPAAAAAIADAIGTLGDLSAIPLVLPLFKETLAPGLRTQFGVALANMLGKVGEFYEYLDIERRQSGKVISLLISEMQKQCERGSEKIQVLNQISDEFDEERYPKVIRLVFKLAFQRYYPALKLEDLISKNVLDWSNEDFEKALGGSQSLISNISAIDYALWVLTALNYYGSERQENTFEEALLALYLLRKIF